MLQRHFLQRFAPTSLALIYSPIDTGSPGHDISEHISRFSAHRIDLEETQLIGGRVIGHVEYDLGPADEAELQNRIATIPYAERKLKSNPNAVEFVRVIKECAGDADPRSIQVWASWAYDKLQEGLNSFNPTSGLTAEEHHARVVTEVLTQLGRMAMELTAVTATNEEQLLEEPEVYEYFGAQHCFTDGDDAKERENLFELRCRELLDRQDTTNPFTAELNFIRSKMSRDDSFSIQLSDTDIYKAHLADDGISGETLEAMVEDFERITEQYTEDGATSLHMSDGERFVVDGTLDEDIDVDYLPLQVAAIIPELKNLFINGIPLASDDDTVYTIQHFLDRQLDLIYGNRGDAEYRSLRTIRTTAYLPAELRPIVAKIETFAANLREELSDFSASARLTQVRAAVRQFGNAELRNPTIEAQFKSVIVRMLPAIAKDNLTVQCGRIYEFEEYRDVYVNADERRYVEDVISQIIQNMSRDFVLSAKRRSKLFRSYADAIERWTDTRKLVECIQQAYEARRKGSLNIKQFTALDTLYQARRAALETAPLVRPVSLDRKYRSQKIAHITTNISRNLLRSANGQSPFKSWVTAVDQANDPLTLALAINLARRDRSQSQLSPRELDQIVSLYETKSILLDTPALNGELADHQSVNVSAILISEALAVRSTELAQLAIRIHTIPLQEKERVRNALREAQPHVYGAIKTDLAKSIESASTKKLMYLRFAFYEDPKTGAPNQPHNLIHLLNQADRAEVWEILKSRTQLPQPTQP